MVRHPGSPPDTPVAAGDIDIHLPAAPEADFSALAARGRLAGSGLSRAGRWSISLSLVAAAFAADYLTGDEVSSSLFYVLAVAAGAWLLGRRPGLLLALL